MSKLIASILLLGVLGGAIGLLLPRLSGIQIRRQEEEPLSAEAIRDLNRLKNQLDSGLITKADYARRKQELLKR